MRKKAGRREDGRKESALRTRASRKGVGGRFSGHMMDARLLNDERRNVESAPRRGGASRAFLGQDAESGRATKPVAGIRKESESNAARGFQARAGVPPRESLRTSAAELPGVYCPLRRATSQLRDAKGGVRSEREELERSRNGGYVAPCLEDSRHERGPSRRKKDPTYLLNRGGRLQVLRLAQKKGPERSRKLLRVYVLPYSFDAAPTRKRGLRGKNCKSRKRHHSKETPSGLRAIG